MYFVAAVGILDDQVALFGTGLGSNRYAHILNLEGGQTSSKFPDLSLRLR
ncbi:MAG: hypothetical protein RL460_563 [Actinomycetota bacterium]